MFISEFTVASSVDDGGGGVFRFRLQKEKNFNNRQRIAARRTNLSFHQTTLIITEKTPIRETRKRSEDSIRVLRRFDARPLRRSRRSSTNCGRARTRTHQSANDDKTKSQS
jgi:hypothetical protein